MLRKIMILCVVSIAGILCANARTNGCVTDKNGNPVAGALVEIKDTNLSQYTDAEGKFDFGDNVYAETLIITAEGYNKKKVGGEDNHIIELNELNWWTESPKWQLFAGLQFMQPTSSFASLTPGIMVGYAKNFGVYAKGFIRPGNTKVESEYYVDSYYTNGKVRYNNKGFMAGLMARLGHPLYLYAGGGIMWYDCVAQEFNGSWYKAYNCHKDPCVELGLMFKYKSLSVNAAAIGGFKSWRSKEYYSFDEDENILFTVNLGVSYWFNF